MHVKVDNFTALKASLLPEVSKFSTPLSATSGDSEEKRPVQKPPSFDGKSQWKPYISQFEIVAGMNQWNDDLLELPTRLPWENSSAYHMYGM